MKNKQLLVEGNDDFHIMSALFKKFNVPKSFDIIDTKGIDKLLKGLKTRLKSKKEAVGILVDADENITGRWQSIVDILKSSGYTNLPKEPNADGTIITQKGKATIGVWLMPTNQTSGMIEDFMEILIPDDDKLLAKAQATLQELENIGINKYKTIHRSKALIHTWLSWQEDPGTPMGLAITKSYFSATNEAFCQKFIDWILELFK